MWEDPGSFEDAPPVGRGDTKSLAAPHLPLAGVAKARERSDTETAAPQRRLSSSTAAEGGWTKRRRRGAGDAAAEEWTEDWVQCSLCAKWRRGISGVSAHAHWQCSFSKDEAFNRCSRPEEGLAAKAAPWYDIYYQVECITDERMVEGRSEFRVQWSGFGPEEDTWELAAADGGSLDDKLVGTCMHARSCTCTCTCTCARGRHPTPHIPAHPSPSQHHPILGTWRSSRIVAYCPWAFVGFAGCGRGLFARSLILQGQAICEYGGPRLPLHMLEGQYVLQVPGRGDN